jgi:L-lactate permease
VSVLVVLVPVLLVVVLGYAVGYAVWEATGAPGNPEVVGWLTGLVLLAAVAWLLLSRRARLRRALRRARARGDDGESARLRAELARRRRERG